MNIDERMRTVNMPQYIKSRGMFQKNKHFIPNFQMATSDTIDKDYINIQNTNIYVLKECYANGLNEAYFNTTTKNRHIYAVLEKYSGYLPCGVVPFLISFEKIAPNEMPTDYTYKEIEVRLEDITIKDLYINANFYAYCYETDTYMPVPAKAAEIATLKSVLERDIVVLGGDAYDRIADYGRIILFLISKVTLTEQEKSALGDMLRHAPSASDLTDISHREGLIQDIVAYAKSNPQKYMEELYHEGNRKYEE